MVTLGKTAGLIFIFAIMISGSASAEYEWSNRITIHPGGMEWQYTENISGLDSYVFKYDIDNNQGNRDKFVSSWELLKADAHLRKKFRTALDSKMDVKIDNSSRGIEVLEIDASLSEKALGPVETLTNITNIYRVKYRFTEGLLINGSTIRFIGEPGSPLIVSFPEGTEIVSTSGIDNMSIHHCDVYGRFEDDFNETNNHGEAEITYRINLTTSANQAQPEVNDSTRPVPTETPFLGTGPILIIITAAVLLLKD